MKRSTKSILFCILIIISLNLLTINAQQRVPQSPVHSGPSQNINPGQEGGQVYSGLGNNPIYGGII